MPIKNIQLKNGNKYPVGEAWRESINDAPIDYHIEYDSSSENTGFLTLAITPAGASEPYQTETYNLYPFTSHIFSNEEMAAGHLQASFDLEWFGKNPIILEVEDPMVTDTNGMVGLFLQMNEISLTSAFSSALPGNVGLVILQQLPIGLLSFSESGTFSTATTGVMYANDLDINVSIDITCSIPTAGSYWITTVDNSILESLNFSADCTVCNYVFDRRYVGNSYILLNNELMMLFLQMNNGVIDLTLFPSLEEKLAKAAIYGMPLMISSPGQSFSMSTAGVSESNTISYVWMIQNSMPNASNPIATITYNSQDHTVTVANLFN